VLFVVLILLHSDGQIREAAIPQSKRGYLQGGGDLGGTPPLQRWTGSPFLWTGSASSRTG